MALNLQGRFAALLNVFVLNQKPDAISRGQLVEHFVKSDVSAPEYMQGLQDIYNGFKLITINIRLNKII